MTEDQSTKADFGPEYGHNLAEFTVGELSQALKMAVEEGFSHVRVRGEISGFKRAASGHLYMALKDEDAVLDAVCWKGTAARLGLAPQDGMEVVATGRLTTYPGRSKYQIVIEAMELAGEGALLKLLEDRKRALAAEGLFDPGAKKPLPFLPDVIGVITSPTGAVIRDILHRLADRFPRRVLLWPVLVQGDNAAAQVAAAIEGFNALAAGGPVPRPDVLIVARGGGSLEDLWAFNEEAVVRAAAASAIPLISAVGHETDTTLIDYAADRRAPTPTAAAEMAVPVRLDLLAQVMDGGTRLTGALGRALSTRRTHLEALSRGLPKPGRLLDDAAQRLDDWSERLANGLRTGQDRRAVRLTHAISGLAAPTRRINEARAELSAEVRALGSAMKAALKDRQSRLAHAGALLESYSYQKTLERGFVLVRDDDGRPVLAAAEVGAGNGLVLEFRDGPVSVVATGGGTPVKKAAKKKAAMSDTRQGELL